MFDRPRDSKKTWRRILIGMVVLGAFLIATRTERAPEPAQLPGETGVVQLDPEFAYGPTIYQGSISGYIEGVPFYHQHVEYTIVDGNPLFEGDIILDLDGPTLAGTGIPNTKFYWPNNLVPYEIDAKLPEQWRVTDAIKHWEEKTSIRFIKRTPENASKYPNYVSFVPGLGCSSYVGMIGGRQTVNLALGCSLGNTIHEIGHVAGLWHEQSRIDRDDFVTVVFENIVPSMAFNFNKQVTNGEDIGNYDYASIMHYPRKAFSKNGEDTIIPKGNQEIGQRQTLSEGDISSVEYMYGKLNKDTVSNTDAMVNQEVSDDTSDPTVVQSRHRNGCDH
jgi:hypothetical protein